MGKAKRHADGSNPAVVTSQGNLISLGYPGESWKPEGLGGSFDGSIIPIPGTELHIILVKGYIFKGKYSIIHPINNNDTIEADDLLMLSCLVREIYDDYNRSSSTIQASEEQEVSSVAGEA